MKILSVVLLLHQAANRQTSKQTTDECRVLYRGNEWSCFMLFQETPMSI